jgi:hypothetical protein
MSGTQESRASRRLECHFRAGKGLSCDVRSRGRGAGHPRRDRASWGIVGVFYDFSITYMKVQRVREREVSSPSGLASRTLPFSTPSVAGLLHAVALRLDLRRISLNRFPSRLRKGALPFGQVTQTFGCNFRRDVTLGCSQHFESNHEFADRR